MSETARLLDDTLDRLLSRRLADPQARADAGLPARLVAEIEDSGLPLLLRPEAAGGFGGRIADAAVLAWRAGWHAAPVPVVEMLLAPLAEHDGPVRLLQGQPPVGPQAAGAAALVVGPEGLAPAGGLSAFMPLSRREGARAGASGVPRDPALAGRILRWGALLTAAEMIGVMARVLEISLDYANTRSQFGRPLGRFQAVQHRMAQAAGELALTEAALALALADEDRPGGPDGLHWRAAKAQAGTAATRIATSAHQVMGAIGFTEDHVLGLYTRRLWDARDDWGRQADCEEALGRRACADPRGLWSHLVDQPLQEETV
ncbi:acyl-CoA dehydrogenase family protein [Frigidibacter sp. MR17.14]|uniref:acyl-CoA dehydrogenase family protein n=1 Tax=Frigidibacter sp. MR17.14 TaxID=3126509 RepID=UPI003012C716